MPWLDHPRSPPVRVCDRGSSAIHIAQAGLYLSTSNVPRTRLSQGRESAKFESMPYPRASRSLTLISALCPFSCVRLIRHSRLDV